MSPLRVASEADIRPFALDVARRFGDPAPTLIQHVGGTRRAATTALGSIVFGDEPVWLIAIRGRLSIKLPRSPRETRSRVAQAQPVDVLTVLIRVVDQESGEIVDSGARTHYPDLSEVGRIVTDLADS